MTDLTRLSGALLVRELQSLRREFNQARAVKDIERMEQLVERARAVAAEQAMRRKEPRRVGARIRGFRPSWAGQEKRPSG